ncbi:hypothetical protein [Leptospira perolatii]|nr:hypothetical protein [Leptospira perolatii]
MKLAVRISWNERDARKVLRVIADAVLVTGLTEIEILDFLPHGLEEEILELKENYDWPKFKKQLIGKLSKKDHSSPALSILHPDLAEEPD